MPIINSLLDNDHYKLTMQQLIFHQFSSSWTKYSFKCRNGNGLPYTNTDDNIRFVNEINKEIDHLCTLRYTQEELNWMRERFGYFKETFLSFLRTFQFDRNHIKVYINKNNELTVDIEGPWLYVMNFEVFVLEIISEKFMKAITTTSSTYVSIEGNKRLKEKIKFLNEQYSYGKNITFVDMGTRRRYSHNWQAHVIASFMEELDNKNMFLGTSNMYFAKEYDIPCFGTMAHELLQGHQQQEYRLEDSQKATFKNWVKEYGTDLGIALSDIFGKEKFFKDFDPTLAATFSGARHDSGSPDEWCCDLIDHYRACGIDPTTKSAVFSDGLNFEEVVRLYDKFHGMINTSYGIGTYLTNDLGLTAMQIVLKMVECNGAPTVKLSDSSGKTMCEDSAFIAYAKNVIKR